MVEFGVEAQGKIAGQLALGFLENSFDFSQFLLILAQGLFTEHIHVPLQTPNHLRGMVPVIGTDGKVIRLQTFMGGIAAGRTSQHTCCQCW
ncbi:hypothetical protein LCGC14_1781590 [marine sediment metagenome]|uniref:Uncharacterized protein n=1 Tax=marine sediment metagenome TaxID=412755 RepID=A0A0F9GVB6_9ZZZZ